jgi:hypothetical protein
MSTQALSQGQLTRIGRRERTTPLNLFVELPEFMHFSVVQHFASRVREHLSQSLLQR